MVNPLVINNKKKKVKRLSESRYYQSDYISNPCDQLFGPPLNSSLNNNDGNFDELNVSSKSIETKALIADRDTSVDQTTNNNSVNSGSNYIPAPKWNRTQNSILEETFKKSRFPKQSELKHLAQRLNVMESDVDEWFRRRRGRDRKVRRKNEALKSLIDKYIDK